MKCHRISLSILLLCAMVLASCTAQQNAGETASSSAEITLEWFCRNYDSNLISSYDEVAAYQKIQENTGVDIHFTHYTSEEQFRLLLSSGQYPDLIEGDWNSVSGGAKSAIDKNIIIKLNDYIAQSAPNLSRIFQEFPDILEEILLYDGTIAYFPSIKSDPTINAYLGPMIRAEWLETLGLEPPQTIDEWTAVLRAFQTQDPNGNGLQDEIPFSIEKSGSLSLLASAFGVGPETVYLNSEGKAIFGPMEQGYRQFLETLHMWYVEGLLDCDYLLMDRTDLNRKVSQDVVGACIGYLGSQMPLYYSYQTGRGENMEYIGVPWPRAADGLIYNPLNINQKVDELGVAVTTTNKYPEKTIAFLDYLYSEEATDLLNWGIEGVTYVNENGQKTFTDLILNNPDGLDAISAITPYALTIRGGTKIMLSEPYRQLNNHLPCQQNAAELWTMGDVYFDQPRRNFSPADLNRYNQILSLVMPYCQEMTAKFILGVESLDNFQDYLDSLAKMGIYEALSIAETYAAVG